MGERSRFDYGGWIPHKDDHGQIGHKNRRYHAIYAKHMVGTECGYSSTMTGNETFTDPLVPVYMCVLDPNGATRTFNPSGTFNKLTVIIKNIGTAYNIIFDSGSSNQTIGPGQLGVFFYDGTTWR